MKCKDKIGIVTGGGIGIGRAIAKALAREGAKVALWDVNEQQATQTASEIEDLGRPAMAIRADVSVSRDVKSAMERVLDAWERVDILVNNAGICLVTPIEEITEAEWDRVIEVNLKGTFLCSQAAMPVMKRQKAGKIINLGSVAGKVGGFAVGSHYSASKAAIMCFTKSLARELAPFGVNVNAIAPGVIETDMTRYITKGDWGSYMSIIPLGRLGKVEDVAQLALYLASEDSNYMTGEIIDINGGQFMD